MIPAAKRPCEGPGDQEGRPGRPLKRRPGRQRVRSTAAPEAPLEALFEWPADYMQTLLRSPYGETLMAHMQAGVELETDYSGAGSVENVAVSINFAAEFFCGIVEPGVRSGFRTLRSSDVDSVCQHILRCSRGSGDSRCIFGDIRDRAPREVLDHLETLEQQFSSLAKAVSPTGPVADASAPPQQSIADLIKEMLGAMVVYLRTHDFDLSARQWCSQHDRLCPLPPSPAKQTGSAAGAAEQPRPLRVWAGGVSCLDWSTMGKRSGWSGDGCIASLIWFFHILAARPHVVIIECTPLFDVGFVQDILRPHYTVMTTKLCPTMLGSPSRRLRSWTVCVLTEEVKVAYPFGGNIFEQFFFRDVLVDPAECLTATTTERNEIKRGMARRRKMPLDDYGEPWPCRSVMSQGARMRLSGYQMIVNSARCRGASTVVIDVNQNPEIACCLGVDEFPVLLRHSNLLVLQLRGAPLPEDDPLSVTAEEHLTIMGWPPPGCKSAWVKHAFQHLVPKLAEKQVKALAGNGMHLHVIGAVLFYIISACSLK